MCAAEEACQLTSNHEQGRIIWLPGLSCRPHATLDLRTCAAPHARLLTASALSWAAIVQVLKRAQRVEFRSGDVILDSQACHTTLVLLVEGLAKFKFMDGQASKGGQWAVWAARELSRLL